MRTGQAQASGSGCVPRGSHRSPPSECICKPGAGRASQGLGCGQLLCARALGLTHLVACLARVKAASWEAGHGRGAVRRLQTYTYTSTSYSVSIARLRPTPISPTEPSRSIHGPCRSLWRADHVWSFRLRLYSGASGSGNDLRRSWCDQRMPRVWLMVDMVWLSPLSITF